jgi:hypothetical protein
VFYYKKVKPMNRMMLSASLTVMMWLVPTYTSAATLTLVHDGKPRCSIILPNDASKVLRETAEDVAGLIERMSGARLPVTSSTSGSSIQLGPVDSELEPLVYHIRREGNYVIVTGGSDQGIANGAYAFMEHLGARFYIPGELGTHLPQLPTISVDDLDISDEPDFISVRGFGGHPEPGEGTLWLKRNRLYGFPNQHHGHNWYNVIGREQVDVNPEWFALQASGGRSDQLCTTHPDVLDSAVAASRRYFDTNPAGPMYSLSPNDNGKFCQCDRCRALDNELGIDPTVEDGSYTDRLVYFLNQVAEQTAISHPGKQLAFYAYISHTDPPRIVKPHPLLLPVVCHTPWDYCQHHAIDDPDCERSAEFAGVIQGWNEVSPQVFVYDYYGHYAWFAPMGIVHTIRRDLPWLRRHGVVGFNSETHGNWWTQGLGFYVASKLFWDLDTDVDAIVAAWYRDMYGPAASMMSQYGAMFEKLLEDVPYYSDTERAFVDSISPDFLARVDALLENAETLAADDSRGTQREVFLERLRRVRAGHNMLRLQVAIEDLDQATAMFQSGNAVILQALTELEADPALHDVIELPLARKGLSQRMLELKGYRDLWTDTNIPGDVRVELRGALSAGDSTAFATGLGYITRWHVLGVFPSYGRNGLSSEYPPDREVDLSAVYEGKLGPISWQQVEVENMFGIVDFVELFADQGKDFAVAYAYVEVNNPGGRRLAQVRFSSNDGGVLRHNDQIIVASDVERGYNPDHDRAMVTLTPGTNGFLVKVMNTEGRFKTSLRLLTFPENEPIIQVK